MSFRIFNYILGYLESIILDSMVGTSIVKSDFYHDGGFLIVVLDIKCKDDEKLLLNDFIKMVQFSAKEEFSLDGISLIYNAI